MIPAKTPMPPYATTDGTYWPDGKGTIPLPVDFPNDGSTYIVITVSNASAGDSLDTLVFAGVDLLASPVPMVAGDEDQSVDDIVAEIGTTTSGDFIGAAAIGGVAVVHWAATDLVATEGPLSYTATTGSGTIITIVATRLVITPASAAAGNKTYYLLDALDPGVTTIEPEFYVPANAYAYTQPPVDPRTWSIVSILQGAWLYIPATHTLHNVRTQTVMGDSGLSLKFGTHLFVELDVAIPTLTTPGDTLPIRIVTSASQGLRIDNTGGASGEIDGHTIVATGTYDRSQFPQQVRKPITYDSTGTEFTIIVN